MFRIRVNHRGEVLSEFKVSSQRVTIGSGPDCDIVLDAERKVQPLHATVRSDEQGNWSISPGDGVSIISRGEAIQPGHALKPGVSFLVGEYVVVWAHDDTSTEPSEDQLETTLPSVEVPRIRVVAGPDSGAIFTLEGDLRAKPVTFGRIEDNTIVLKDRSVSRHHARLREDERGYVLEDTHSTYGFRMDGGPESRRLRLLNGSLFLLGDTGLLFECPVRPMSGDEIESEMAAAARARGGAPGELVEGDTAPYGAGMAANTPTAPHEALPQITPKDLAGRSGRMNPAMWPLMIGALVVIALILVATLVMLLMSGQQLQP